MINQPNYEALKNIIKSNPSPIYNNYPQCFLCNNLKEVIRIHKSLYPTLVVHHIDGNPYNDDLDNLMILCKGCHQKLHSIYRKLGVKTVPRKNIINKQKNGSI